MFPVLQSLSSIFLSTDLLIIHFKEINYVGKIFFLFSCYQNHNQKMAYVVDVFPAIMILISHTILNLITNHHVHT